MALNPLSESERDLGRVVIVTGGGKGFGRYLVEEYLRLGWRVATVSRTDSDISDLITSVPENLREKLIAECIDVTDTVGMESFVAEVETKWSRVDVLINNAGMRFRKSVLDITTDELNEVLQTNLMSAFTLSQRVLPTMIARGCGNIINISSVLGTNTLPDLSAYVVSKFGLNGMTKAMAVEFAEQGININAVSPGFCKTSYYENFKKNEDLHKMTLDRTPQGRWGESSEVGAVCLFLSSEGANFINGAILPVDGAWTA